MAADKGLEEIPECKSLKCILFSYLRLTAAATAQIESNYDEVTDSFDSMALKSELLRGIRLVNTLEKRGKTDLIQAFTPMGLSDHLPFNNVRLCQLSRVCQKVYCSVCCSYLVQARMSLPRHSLALAKLPPSLFPSFKKLTPI